MSKRSYGAGSLYVRTDGAGRETWGVERASAKGGESDCLGWGPRR
jgi:hypothetical protein